MTSHKIHQNTLSVILQQPRVKPHVTGPYGAPKWKTDVHN